MHYYQIPKPLALTGIAILTFSLVVNFIGVVGQLRSLKAIWQTENAGHYTYAGSDYPSSLPVTLEQVGLTLEPTNRYGLTAPDDWASLFPAGNGWVRLGPDGRHFAVSMYHQLHCLNAMRHALVQARDASGMHLNNSEPTTSASESSGNSMRGRSKRAPAPARPLLTETPMQAFSHADHCFNYLRQNILCAADTTIEASIIQTRPDGVNDSAASGIGMTHTCRDWTQLRRYLEKNTEEWSERDASRTRR